MPKNESITQRKDIAEKKFHIEQTRFHKNIKLIDEMT
jgi:hypothetical protein